MAKKKVKRENKISGYPNADSLREKFLKFFAAKKHKIVASDSLIPTNDPTVLFTSAGMNQFKKQFLGHITGFRRAASAQRCLRTDDLPVVGKTNYHHTFFEMLGNFSFGDYFKKEAIGFAWEFLTQELKIDKEKLWASIYKEDEESYQIWKNEIGIPEKRIVRLGDKENFWPSEAKTKGPNGPCGACSEIFFDFGPSVGCGKPDCTPACSCGRFVEVWNLVFTQFNRREDGSLEPLPSKNIDTGMGLERLVAVMQGVLSNFDTDLFVPLISEIKKSAKKEDKELIHAIADHIRAVVFAIYDGVVPSNEQRGYVVRKLIRKAAFDGYNLGITKPFLYKLVPTVAKIMHSPYPELVRRREEIGEIILREEKNFSAVLNSAQRLFEAKFRAYLAPTPPTLRATTAYTVEPISMKQPSKGTGMIAFELYDTYGIPLEITRDWLEKRGIGLDMTEFNQRLTQQKELSKAKSTMKGDVFSVKLPKIKAKETKFLGYQGYNCKAKIIAILKDDQAVSSCQEKEKVKLVLDKTVFYAESGGQVADKGKISKASAEFEVSDAQKIEDVTLHEGIVAKGKFKKGDLVSVSVDQGHRLAVARNHTATHLLQASLRKVLGEHVQQQGSLVAQEKLRFDFTHFQGISKQELDRIEYLVNQLVLKDESVQTKELSLAAAKESGFLAFFGEKYKDKVRAVMAGEDSRELCGGTHLERTGQIGLFRITGEGSISSGVRRIEAVTGEPAYQNAKKEQEILGELANKLNAPAQNLGETVEKMNLRLKDLQRNIDNLKFQAFNQNVDTAIQQAVLIKDMKVVSLRMDEVEMNLLRRMSDILRAKLASGIFALGSVCGDKVFLILGVTQDLVKKGMDATKLIKDIAGIIGGSGGGRADFAQAGGDKPKELDAALNRLKEII
ncbi:MAG: alanine--tRNA ligase [Candidatus Omnitrophica bacterium]|nr:alanine--tRNA ligase [Candidatus Omnitrophota bacterium]